MTKSVNLTKKQFVNYIKRIKKTLDREQEFSAVVEKLCNDSCFITGMFCEEIETIISLLKAAMGMFDENDVIEYFIYELDFGKEYSVGCYEEEDGTPIDISSAEALYDYLTK